MNRNAESHFALTPSTLDMRRSVFDRSFTLKTTFNAGKLIPVYVEPDVLPGDTFNLDFGAIVRMTPNVHPTMDNCYLDVFFFFVPNRLVWQHWKEFCGENSNGFWIPNTEYTVPELVVATNSSYNGFEQGSVADYMGLPTKVKGLRVNALPFRAYALIWNEWFRDQNLQTPCLSSTTDTNNTYLGLGNSYVQSAFRGGELCPVNKYHDLFTSLLPGVQKGPQVALPINNPLAPIHTEPYNPTQPQTGSLDPNTRGLSPTTFSMLGKNSNNEWIAKNFYLSGNGNDGTATTIDTEYTQGVPMRVENTTIYGTSTPFAGATPFTLGELTGVTGGSMRILNDFYADLTQIGVNISDVRTSFQIQKFYEKRGLYGSRYTEIVRSFFGVTSPDGRLQRPEYLGGAKIPINISQVVQTSSTDSTSPQANVAAYSLTTSRDQGFRYNATEHGIILGLCCVRTDHTYQQGIPRGFLRKTVFDYYWPTFSAISNQPVYNSQIYAQGSGVTSDGVPVDQQTFGFSEAWADYRYANTSNITGQFRSNATGTLDSWHYADYYTQLPTLSSDWIQETAVNIDRTLAVSSAVSDQFIADFRFGINAYRVMPVYSVPGLVDHF